MTATATIRVEQQTRDKLLKLAKQERKPLGEVVKEAVARYERDRFFDELDAAYARLKADPEAWADYQAELALWDSTLMDGLEDYPWEGE